MTKEEAINSFKKSNEQTKLNIQVHRHIMDTSEIRELEWYIERDKMAIEALEQEPKIGHWIEIGNKGHIDVDSTILYQEMCDKCKGLSYFRKSCGKLVGAEYCPNCGRRMTE